MQLSKTFHISAKKHAIKNAQDLVRASKHNLRSFRNRREDDYIEQLVECSSIYQSVKQIYKDEFGESVREYNSHQKRNDRKIKDYFKKVCDSRNDVAVEIIFQLGDKEFWKEKSLEEKKTMRSYFLQQFSLFKQLFPGFVVADATIHYNEFEKDSFGCPHMHLVGVPVVETDKTLRKQCIKTEVFTKKSLETAQDVLHAHAENYMKSNDLFKGVEFKQKEKGRNRDYTKQELAIYKRLEKEVKHENKDKIIAEAKAELKEEWKSTNKSLLEAENKLLSLEGNISTLKAKESKYEANIRQKKEEYEELVKNPPKVNIDYKKLYEEAQKLAEKYRLERDEEYNLRLELEEKLEELGEEI